MPIPPPERDRCIMPDRIRRSANAADRDAAAFTLFAADIVANIRRSSE
jgi:hypothetical protein